MADSKQFYDVDGNPIDTSKKYYDFEGNQVSHNPPPPKGYSLGEPITANPPSQYQSTAEKARNILMGGSVEGPGHYNPEERPQFDFPDWLKAAGGVAALAQPGIGAARAIASGSYRPALALAGGLGTTGLAEKIGEKFDLPWYIKHPLAIAAGAKVGGAISPELLEGNGLAARIARKYVGEAPTEDVKFTVNPRIKGSTAMRYGGPPTDYTGKGNPTRVGKVVSSNLEGDEAVPSGARDMKTLNDIAQGQAGKKFNNLTPKEKSAVMDIYDKLRLGQQD